MSEQLTCPGCGDRLPDHLSTKEVANQLGLSERTVQRMATLGDLRGFRIGRLWRICPPSVREYLQSCMERARA